MYFPPYFLLPLLGLLTLLIVASVLVRVCWPHKTSLRHQVNAWWVLMPTGLLAIGFAPMGIAILSLVIIAVALFELTYQARAKEHKSLLSSLAALAILVLGTLTLWTHQYPQLAQAQAWLLFLFAVTSINDVSQFVIGSAFGKRALAPRISPNKTIEGLFGGLLISPLVAIALGSALQLLHWPLLALFGFMIALTGSLGDLLFSYAKRQLQIKDFSKLIPGHGGVLDRVDSLLLSTPAFLLLLYFFKSH